MTSERDERIICYIVNTTEYCHKTSGELADNLLKIIDPQFAEQVDMSEVQDEFSAVITKALMTLVQGLETKFDADQMAAMTRVTWNTLESVGDQSAYVNGINSILSTSIPVLGTLLSPVYLQFFLDKVSWTESKPKLEKDPQRRATNPDLDDSDLEKLFREHIKILHEDLQLLLVVFSQSRTGIMVKMCADVLCWRSTAKGAVELPHFSIASLIWFSSDVSLLSLGF